MSLAQKSLAMNDMGRAQQLLDAHRPAADEVDLRGWEWRYLWQQCRSDALGGLCRYEKSQARSVAYSPDGRVLAVSGIFPGFVDIWDVPARKLIRRLQQNQFSRVAFSPHGDLLLTKNEDQIRFWRTDTWDLIRQVSLTGKVLALKFSPDGTCLASLILPDELTVWEVMVLWRCGIHPRLDRSPLSELTYWARMGWRSPPIAAGWPPAVGLAATPLSSGIC